MTILPIFKIHTMISFTSTSITLVLLATLAKSDVLESEWMDLFQSQSQSQSNCTVQHFAQCESEMLMCGMICFQHGPDACNTCYNQYLPPCLSCIEHPPHPVETDAHMIKSLIDHLTPLTHLYHFFNMSVHLK